MDTSSLLEAWGHSYRPQNFRTFWRRLDLLIAEGRCVICEEVRTEVEEDANKLIDWVKQHPGLVVDFSRDQELVVQRIIRAYPKLVNIKKNKGWADPFVIALAQVQGHIVVTEEGPGTQDSPRIPFICRVYGVDCMNLSDMIAMRGGHLTDRWAFVELASELPERTELITENWF